ncbi:D-lactate dehydrogenase (cytochrome) [Mesobacillus persicus]|uniref:D-lactate dehydrogenase (cytochrome) n=1 Tax=Mesobacillus persicus TaxID=930146 RepID=A0A1H7VSA6_9BACI|nr:FAD-linked oxidase C-terminal domain-containing protein [Mesobacillus persicus]SEM11677.1 D-lactate dehydrogenase (cytochrome) [Mesobacillus persicus]
MTLMYDQLLNIIRDVDRISLNETILEQHSKGMTYHTPQKPELVVYPQTKEEVSQILTYANERCIPVTPFGVGSSLEGHIIPAQGGITVNLSLMNKVVEVRPEDFLVKVQPGVTRSQLNKELKRHGLFFPVDPGADATIGGMASTNASGTNSVKYGTMKDQVLGLEVVLADGRVVRTGGMAVKSSAGYNLTSLLVGSEGTLGIITEITLRLQGIPEIIVASRALFASIEAAGNAAAAMLKSGLDLGKVELVDQATIQAVNAYKNTDYQEVPTLFIEMSGSEQAVKKDMELAQEIAVEEGCQLFESESDSLARAKLWEARHHVAFAIQAANPGKGLLSTDVCVPISELPNAIKETRKLIERHGVEAAIFGHVGDGNYHAVLSIDANDPESVKKIEEINQQIVAYALAKGGTCTGEHGIGLGKKQFLRLEHGEAVDIMKEIKVVFDPKRILNPGKIF